MAELMEISRSWVIVENYQLPDQCPDCGKQIKLFGESHIDEIAEKYGVPVLAKIPVDPALAKAVDAGAVELFEGDWMDGAMDRLETL